MAALRAAWPGGRSPPRNLLCTVVTRTKKLLIIVGSRRTVENMVNNDRRTLRYTCLRDMIEKELGK